MVNDKTLLDERAECFAQCAARDSQVGSKLLFGQALAWMYLTRDDSGADYVDCSTRGACVTVCHCLT